MSFGTCDKLHKCEEAIYGLCKLLDRIVGTTLSIRVTVQLIQKRSSNIFFSGCCLSYRGRILTPKPSIIISGHDSRSPIAVSCSDSAAVLYIAQSVLQYCSLKRDLRHVVGQILIVMRSANSTHSVTKDHTETKYGNHPPAEA